jgi:hypothetical protein
MSGKGIPACARFRFSGDGRRAGGGIPKAAHCSRQHRRRNAGATACGICVKQFRRRFAVENRLFDWRWGADPPPVVAPASHRRFCPRDFAVKKEVARLASRQAFAIAWRNDSDTHEFNNESTQ